MINSVFKTGKNYYPQVFLEGWKYVIKAKEIHNYSTDDVEISSDFNSDSNSARKNSDGKNSDYEEISDEEILKKVRQRKTLMKKILMKKILIKKLWRKKIKKC